MEKKERTKSRFFNHDQNARGDEKIVQAELHFSRTYGLLSITEPYTIFFKTLELLFERDGYMKMTDLDVVVQTIYGNSIFTDTTNLSLAKQKVEYIIANTELFVVDKFQGTFYSERLLLFQRSLNGLSIKNKINGLKSAIGRSEVTSRSTRDIAKKERLSGSIEKMKKDLESAENELIMFEKYNPTHNFVDIPQRPLSERQPIVYNSIGYNKKETLPTTVENKDIFELGTANFLHVVLKEYFGTKYAMRFQDEFSCEKVVGWLDGVAKSIGDVLPDDEQAERFHKYLLYTFQIRPSKPNLCNPAHFASSGWESILETD